MISIIFMIILFISKGGIGQGDMFYLCFFASMFGYIISFIAFLLSFWIATIILIIPYLLKKIDKKTKIPFLPFIFS
ncbi:MAG TPA: prepilin peptidase, partial [Spirochaetota bacterium]|nr:prepilin peptidase [Spirochaetota bacterium]